MLLLYLIAGQPSNNFPARLQTIWNWVFNSYFFTSTRLYTWLRFGPCTRALSETLGNTWCRNYCIPAWNNKLTVSLIWKMYCSKMLLKLKHAFKVSCQKDRIILISSTIISCHRLKPFSFARFQSGINSNCTQILLGIHLSRPVPQHCSVSHL